MNNAPITLNWGTLPPGTCWPATPQNLVPLLAAILSGYLPGNYSTFNFGPSEPSPDDRDKPWIKTDNSGYLEGVYVYAGGLWCRPHPVPPGSQQRIIWRGSESDLWSYDGGDGTNPGTSAPTPVSGAMWQRDTDFGSDSTVFRFPVGIGKNPTAFDGGSAKQIGVGDTGGVERVSIEQANLPKFDPRLAANSGDGTWNASAATGDSVSGPGIGAGGVDTRNELKLTASYGAETPTTVDNLPPFLGVIFAKRTNRTMIVATL